MRVTCCESRVLVLFRRLSVPLVCKLLVVCLLCVCVKWYLAVGEDWVGNWIWLWVLIGVGCWRVIVV
jgi:hypothetical protein